jgi:hypothetical protein
LLVKVNTEVEVEVAVNLRPTVSRPVCPGVRRPSGTCDQFFIRHEISFRQLRLCYFVAPSLTRERVCNLLLNCFWALPKQSLLSRSPAELMAIFYCLVYLYPPGTGWPSYTLGHWVTTRGDYGRGILTRLHTGLPSG